MAIFHMNMSIISRGKGQSAIASSAYRSGEKLYSQRYGKSNFYSREVQPDSFMLKPDHAPDWTLSREKLWNKVEEIEKQKNSQLAREFSIALPIELNDEEQKNLIKEYVQSNFVDKGMVADVSIHRDKEQNPHAHVMLTVRPFLENGEWGNKSKKEYIKDENGDFLYYESGEKKSRKIDFVNWNKKTLLKNWRKNWADTTNKYLEKNGFSERISEKSFAELGIEKIPTIHEGHVAREMEANGKVSDRCEENREIRKQNYEKSKERSEHIKKENSKSISNSLSPEDKKQMSKIAKNLKVYINYDNLLDKERMTRNWEKSIEYNEIIKDEEADLNTLKELSDTKKEVELGKEILNKQADRIYKKYYPDLAKEMNYAPYYKLAIAQKTLEKDSVLSTEEIASVLDNSREKRYDFTLKKIFKNPYKKSARNYQQYLSSSQNELKQFYKDNKVDINSISSLDEKAKKEYKSILKKRDLNLDTLKLLDKYYTETIKEKYPTVDLSDTSVPAKESLSKAIDYYGNRYSFDKISRLVAKEQVNKYSYTEQKIGMNLINKIDNNEITPEKLDEIENDYRFKEIYNTVSDPDMREIFEEEYYSNQSNYQSNNESFVGLFKNLSLYQNIAQAQNDNVKREKDATRNKFKTKKMKGKEKKNNKKVTYSI